MSKRKGVDIETAMTIVPDDLGDGAYFAMLDELTGSEPGGACDLIEQADPPRSRKLYRVKYYDAKLSKKGKGTQSRTFTDRAKAQEFADANQIYAGPCKVEEYTP